MGSTTLFVVFLIIVAIGAFAYGFWFETKRKPRIKKKHIK